MTAPKETKPECVDAICPNCRCTEIVDIQKEQIPCRHHCGTRMVFRELLREGKSN